MRFVSRKTLIKLSFEQCFIGKSRANQQRHVRVYVILRFIGQQIGIYTITDLDPSTVVALVGTYNGEIR